MKADLSSGIKNVSGEQDELNMLVGLFGASRITEAKGRRGKSKAEENSEAGGNPAYLCSEKSQISQPSAFL